jgi:hypothetical protein
MLRTALICLLTLSLSATCFAAKTTVVLNGKVVAIPMVEAGGHAYLDVAALAKILGWKVTYNAAAHKVMLSTAAGAAAPTTTAGGHGAAGTGSPSSRTVELAGDNGVLGRVYSLRKDTPLHFSLKSAEFTTQQVVVGEHAQFPSAAEKLLVLHFTVQNPSTDERYVRYDSLRFTAVDAMNVNHEGDNVDWGDEQSHQPVRISLKPAQRIDCYTALKVPAKGPIPKLMVLPGSDNDGPVLRYDLRDKVTGLQPPIADPADATGATALDKVPAAAAAAYPLEGFDFTLEGLGWSTADLLGDGALENGERYLVATVLLQNDCPTEQYARYDMVTPTLISTDNEELKYNDMLLATANRAVRQDVAAGQSMRVRLIFTVPADTTPGTLSVCQGDSRTFVYQVGR